ncbi:O-antigen ligase WaaL [Maricurvus nonylphenolicus]|uniref:O-antigen ligase family protein n=1 Tax=Maricurvus nonylphenolicus TaxID=1008307 RepID=UPI0036F444FF
MDVSADTLKGNVEAIKKSDTLFDRVMVGWFTVGVFLLLAGMFLVTKRTGFTTIVYAFLVLPALIVLVSDLRNAFSKIYRLDVLLPISLVCYLILSSVWGGGGSTGDYIKRGLCAILTCYGLCYFSKKDAPKMELAVISAIVCVACACIFWIVDFYVLMGNPLSERFMAGQSDYFSLYKDGYYAAFFNPLRLSHVLTFMFFMTIAAFCYFSLRGLVVKGLVVLSAVSIGLLIFFAQTRTAWLLCGGAIGLAVFNRWGWKGIAGYMAIAVAAAFFFMQIDHSVVNRGLSYRPEIWAAGIEKIEGAWWIGRGLGAEMLLHIEGVSYPFAEAHNIYIMMAYYGGGVALAIWFLSVFFVLIKPFLKDGLNLWVALWGSLFLLGGMTDGAGLLSRPNEHWFTLVIPLAFLYFSAARNSSPMIKLWGGKKEALVDG